MIASIFFVKKQTIYSKMRGKVKGINFEESREGMQ